MSDATNKMENVIVPIFRTFEELQSDEDAILAGFEEDWQQAFKVFEGARDAVLEDKATLAKVVDTEPSPFAALKKSGRFAALKKLDPGLAAKIDEMSAEFAVVVAEHKRLKKEITAGCEAINNLNDARRAAISKRDERMFGFGALRRRSQRFASAHERRNYGPGASSLPPAS